MSVPTFDEVYRTVEEVVEENPLRVNGICVHFEYDSGRAEPVCVAGHVFDRLGGAAREYALEFALARSVASHAGLDEDSKVYLAELQRVADGDPSRTTWSQAKAAADAYFGLVNADA